MIGPGGDAITQEDVDQALAYIEAHTEISEVILTGGDPLVLSPDRLAALIQRLQAVPHLRWIRIHTRVPVVSPKKITGELIAALRGIKPVVIAIHVNHAREVTHEASAALMRLTAAGFSLLGQSVLLKGVNNTVNALVDLFETLMANRVKPYYLHHPDLTTGTSHFRLGFDEGMALMAVVRQRVSGICLPEYVVDIPGGYTKIPVTPQYVVPIKGQKGAYLLIDTAGNQHKYRDPL
jgi:lysine 2,3-aminomutase